MGTCYVINWIQVSNFTFLKKTLRFSKQMKEWKKPQKEILGEHIGEGIDLISRTPFATLTYYCHMTIHFDVFWKS